MGNKEEPNLRKLNQSVILINVLMKYKVVYHARIKINCCSGITGLIEIE